MKLVISRLLSSSVMKLRRKYKLSKGSVECPGGGGGCLPGSSVCDGVETCEDGSDEDTDMCRRWDCVRGFSKCPDNVQCISDRDLCRKSVWRSRSHRRDWGRVVSCKNGGTNSVESCLRYILKCLNKENIMI